MCCRHDSGWLGRAVLSQVAYGEVDYRGSRVLQRLSAATSTCEIAYVLKSIGRTSLDKQSTNADMHSAIHTVLRMVQQNQQHIQLDPDGMRYLHHRIQSSSSIAD